MSKSFRKVPTKALRHFLFPLEALKLPLTQRVSPFVSTVIIRISQGEGPGKRQPKA